MSESYHKDARGLLVDKNNRIWIPPDNDVARSPKYVLLIVAGYVKCCKCGALRRLPGPLSDVDGAPASCAENWDCTQNHWDGEQNFCLAAPEFQNDEIKEKLPKRAPEALQLCRAARHKR